MSYAKALQVVVLISDHNFPPAVAEDEVRSQHHDRHHLTDYPRNCELHSIVNFIQTIVKFQFSSLGLCIANNSDCISVLVLKKWYVFSVSYSSVFGFFEFSRIVSFSVPSVSSPYLLAPATVQKLCQ